MAMRAKLAFAAVALVAAAAAAGKGNAVVTPVWLPSVELTPRSDYSIVEQNVAVDQRDDVLAVWSGKSGVQARYRPAGGAWQDARSTGGVRSRRDRRVRRGRERDGRLASVHEHVSQMTTAVRRVDGSWSSPVDPVHAGPVDRGTPPGRGGSGAAVASWIETDGHVAVVEASVRAPGSNDWSPAAQVSSVGADAEDSSPAIDDTGDAVVGFTRDDPAGEIVWAAFRPADGDWQRAVDLSTRGTTRSEIQVAIRPGGNRGRPLERERRGPPRHGRPRRAHGRSRRRSRSIGVKSLVADSAGDVVAAWQSDQVMVSELPAGSGTWTSAGRDPVVAARGARVHGRLRRSARTGRSLGQGGHVRARLAGGHTAPGRRNRLGVPGGARERHRLPRERPHDDRRGRRRDRRPSRPRTAARSSSTSSTEPRRGSPR